MIWYCHGTFQGDACNYPGITQAATPPQQPPRCPKCQAQPITWSATKKAKKPGLFREGGGWRCNMCRRWVTGAFHFCIPVNIPALGGHLVRPRSNYMPLMNEIVRLAKEKYPGESDPNLVAKQLKTVANLHRWAPWLVTRATEWLQEWPPETRRELFILMEDAIRQRFTGGDSLIPPAELALFANGPPSQLRNRLEKGWILLGKLWPKLNGAARKNLVCDHKTGLRHEKGYNHVLEDLKSLALEHRLITMAEL